MEDNKTVNDMQQTLNEMTPETVEANEVLPQELTSRDLAQILIYLSLRAPISKENRRHLAEAARRLQRERVANISQEGAITVLQSTGWMQEHDREILSPYACVTVLQKCGWMADHDNKLLKSTRENLNRDIDALEAEKHGLREELKATQKECFALQEQLKEAETHRKGLEKGIESLQALEEETNRRLREQLEAAYAEKRQLETDNKNLREALEQSRKTAARYYEERNASREENEKLKAENASHKRNTDQMNNIIRHLRHEAAESVSAPEGRPLYRIHDFRELAGNPANVFVDLLRIAKKLDRRLEVTIS